MKVNAILNDILMGAWLIDQQAVQTILHMVNGLLKFLNPYINHLLNTQPAYERLRSKI